VVPARLRIQQRRGNVDGQAVRYVVPVLDVSVRYAELLGGNQGGLSTPSEMPALPSGYTPIEKAAGNGATLADGLREAETQTLAKPPRVPLAEDDDILDDEPGAPPSPSPSEGGPAQEPQNSPDQQLTLPATRKKLDALVGSLRDAGEITTEMVYVRLAEARSVDVETLIDAVYGRDAEGVLHWSPLRDALKLKEARELHSKLATLWLKVKDKPKAAA
jgi:hypothetical protein